jgi:signal transduction histidine kinase
VKENSLVGQPNWIPLDKKDFIVRYSCLNSGKYILIVRKLNGFGINNHSFKKIYLIVPPLWYETGWAFVLFMVAALLLIYFYNVYRLRSVNLENARLEEIILTRTNSLENTLRELEESKNQLNSQVHIMSRIMASITHDVQSPLNYIAFVSGDIPDMVEEKQFAKISEIGAIISALSHRTRNMLRDLLNYIKIQVYGKRMYAEEVNLKKLVDDKIGLFESVVAHKGNHFANEIPDTIQVTTDYQLLSIVIHNLIDNAVKYTHQDKIRIYTEARDSKTELIISNPGTGLAREIMERINSPASVSDINHPSNNEGSTGLGLIIVKEVAELIGVRVEVTQTDLTNFHLLFN